MISDLKCVVCDTPLTGGLDTYGNVHQEMCRECYWSLFDDLDPVYGKPDMLLFVRETEEDERL